MTVLPNAGARSLSVIGSKWKNLDDGQRSHFDSLAVEDKKRFALELVRWRQEQEWTANDEQKNADKSGPEGNRHDQKPKARDSSQQYGTQIGNAGGARGYYIPQMPTQRQAATGDASFALHGLPHDELQPLRVFPREQAQGLNIPGYSVGIQAAGLLRYPYEGLLNLPSHRRPEPGVEMLLSSLTRSRGRNDSLQGQGGAGERIRSEESNRRSVLPGSLAWLAAELGQEAVEEVIRIFR